MPSQASITWMLPAPEPARLSLTHNLVTPMLSGILILPHRLKNRKTLKIKHQRRKVSSRVSCGEDPVPPEWGANARAYPLR